MQVPQHAPTALRAAQPNDAAIAAELILAAGPHAMTELFGAGSPGSALSFFEHAFRQPRGVFSYRNCLVATEDKAVVGLAVTYALENEAAMQRTVFWQLLQHHRLADLPRVLYRALQIDRTMPRPPHHGWYITIISVVKHMRGRGVADALIAAGMEQGRRHGAATCYAHVAADNQPSLRMVYRHGFTQLVRGAGQDTSTPGTLAAQILLVCHLTTRPDGPPGATL